MRKALAAAMVSLLLLAGAPAAFAADTAPSKGDVANTQAEYEDRSGDSGTQTEIDVQGNIIADGNIAPQKPPGETPGGNTGGNSGGNSGGNTGGNTGGNSGGSSGGGTTVDHGTPNTTLTEPPIDAGLTVDTPDPSDGDGAGTNGLPGGPDGITGDSTDTGDGVGTSRAAAENWSLLSLLMSAEAIFASMLLLTGAYLKRRKRKAVRQYAENNEPTPGGAYAKRALNILAVCGGITTPVIWLLLDDLSQSMVALNTNTAYVGMAFAIHLALMIAPRFVRTSAAAGISR
jgi:hypothetical protein